MEMKLFIEDMKGYTKTYNNVKKVSIKKIDNKNTLIVNYNANPILFDNTIDETIPLNEIKLAFAINLETMEEYFRYEK